MIGRFDSLLLWRNVMFKLGNILLWNLEVFFKSVLVINVKSKEFLNLGRMFIEIWWLNVISI